MASRDQMWVTRQAIENDPMARIAALDDILKVILVHARDKSHREIIREAYSARALLNEWRNEASREWTEAEERAPHAE